MKYQIILKGDDLKEDVEGFVSDIEHNLTAQSGEDGDGYVIVVDTIEYIANP
jgi:hypothetical protein